MTTEVVQPCDAAHPVALDRRATGRGPAREDGADLQPGPTGQVIARVPRGGAEEVARAVAAAHAAFPAWRDTPLIARSQVLFRFRELLFAHREELAALITRDHGKTFPRMPSRR